MILGVSAPISAAWKIDKLKHIEHLPPLKRLKNLGAEMTHSGILVRLPPSFRLVNDHCPLFIDPAAPSWLSQIYNAPESVKRQGSMPC